MSMKDWMCKKLCCCNCKCYQQVSVIAFGVTVFKRSSNFIATFLKAANNPETSNKEPVNRNVAT